MEGCIDCSVKNEHNVRMRNSSDLRTSNAPLSTYLFFLEVNSSLKLFYIFAEFTSKGSLQ